MVKYRHYGPTKTKIFVQNLISREISKFSLIILYFMVNNYFGQKLVLVHLRLKSKFPWKIQSSVKVQISVKNVTFRQKSDFVGKYSIFLKKQKKNIGQKSKLSLKIQILIYVSIAYGSYMCIIANHISVSFISYDS